MQRFRIIPSTRFLQAIFYIILAHRFVFPFMRNPMRSIENDWGRHWDNGINLLNPTMWGSIDPKLFQVWIYLLHNITGDNLNGVAWMTGLLCASMPWLWYLCCRELFSRRTALIAGIIIGIMPSMLLTYSLFMNESLTLNMLALSLWLTLRAARKQTFSSFVLACLAIAPSLLARLSILPILAGAYAWILLQQKRKIDALIISALIAGVWLVPSGILNSRQLHFFSPIQFSDPTKIYRFGGTTTYSLHTSIGNWQFTCPSFSINPLDPIGHYQSARRKEIFSYEVDLNQGRDAWKNKIQEVKQNYTSQQWLEDLRDNVVFFSLGHSWPFASPNSDYALERLNYHMRWVWPPIMLIILCYAPLLKVPPRHGLLLLWTIGTMFLFFIQQSAIMEGRYRMPLEPLFLISIIIIWQARHLPPNDNPGLIRIIWNVYLKPLRFRKNAGIIESIYRKPESGNGA